MRSRLELQSKLEELLGNRHVYYMPPENLKMEWPAIRYSKSKIISTKANNYNYTKYQSYELTVIDNKPDNEVINKILDLPHTIYDRTYTSNNLVHDVILIYY